MTTKVPSRRASRVRATVVLAVLALALPGAALAQVQVGPVDPEFVANALAESPGPWADEAIEVVVSRGLYIGYPDGSFGWRDGISRAEMAVVIARLISTFGLDSFDPEAQAALRQAVVELDDELAGVLEEVSRLRGQIEAVGGDVSALEEADAALAQRLADLEVGFDDLGARLAELEEALGVVRGYATIEDLAALEAELDGARAAVADLEARVAALEGRPAGEGGAPSAELAGLRDAIASLREQQEVTNERLVALENSIQGLDGVDAPSVDFGAIESRFERLTNAQSSLDARVGDVETRLTGIEERLAALEGRVDDVAGALLPDRGGFYVSASAVIGDDPVNDGVLARVALGHDHLLGNIGFRLSYEHSFGSAPSAAAAAFTYTTAFGRSDGYFGLGGGVAFEDPDPVGFGEALVGIQYRLSRRFAVFMEGRYRTYLDGSGQRFPGFSAGLQFRF